MMKSRSSSTLQDNDEFLAAVEGRRKSSAPVHDHTDGISGAVVATFRSWTRAKERRYGCEAVN
jgi:hypothetical protein